MFYNRFVTEDAIDYMSIVAVMYNSNMKKDYPEFNIKPMNNSL